MALYPRYALYFMPEPTSALYRLGAALLGHDAFTGAVLDPPEAIVAALPDWRALTRAPGVYGFHATLKAPFALAPGLDEADLVRAVAAFTETRRQIPVVTPVVDLLGSFVAIEPAAPAPGLDDLAANCVRAFDSFRAPLSPEDRARRDPASLSARRVAHLDRWGYPYVMDDFRFHMTLTGRVPVERRAAVLAASRAVFGTLGFERIAIDRLALSRQAAAGVPFRVLTYHALRPLAF
jgi:putative phosphonate metabolism protein